MIGIDAREIHAIIGSLRAGFGVAVEIGMRSAASIPNPIATPKPIPTPIMPLKPL
jgi:hypothetical protein